MLYGLCTGNVKKGTGNDKQGKDAGNRTLCPYRNFSQAITDKTKQLYAVSDKQKLLCTSNKLCLEGLSIVILA